MFVSIFPHTKTAPEKQTGIKTDDACDYISHNAIGPPVFGLEIFLNSYISEQIRLTLLISHKHKNNFKREYNSQIYLLF
jgi:hypothetical protein